MEIRPFDNDYPALHRLIHTAWPQEHGSYIDYTPQHLAALLTAPEAAPELTLAAYDSGRLVSFLLSQVKELSIQGRKYIGLLNTLAATDPAAASAFPYLKLRDKAALAGRSQGCDLTYGFAAAGIANNRIEQAWAAKRGFACLNPARFGWWGRLTAAPAGPEKASLSGRPFNPADAPACLDLITDQTGACAIRQVWTEAGFIRTMTNPDLAEATVIEQDGRIVGLIGYAVRNFRSGPAPKPVRRPTGLIHHLFLDRLAPAEQAAALTDFLADLADRGVEAVTVPDNGAFNPAALQALGFRRPPSPALGTNLYLTFFDQPPPLNSEESFYLEII